MSVPTLTKSHRDQALEQLSIALIYKDTLDDLKEVGGDIERGLELEVAIEQALEISQIHATLDVAAAIRAAFPAIPPAYFTGADKPLRLAEEVDNDRA